MTQPKPSLSDLRIDESARRGGRRAALWIVIAVVVLTAAIGGWFIVGSQQAAVVVRTEPVVERSPQTVGGAAAVLNASGYVTARRRATVSSKVTGKVREVYVEEGMAVADGQVLARLDDTTTRAYLAVAEAELSAARRGLTETEVRLAESRITLGRVRSLVADGVSQKADLDAAQASVDALAARLEASREQVRVAEAQVALRQTELGDLVIRAPFGGVAISKDAQPGEMISPVSAGGGFTRTGICTIVDMKSLEIEVDVNESYIGRIAPGQRVEARLDAYPDWPIAAHVITPVPTADRQRATVLVRIAFERLDARILPDMSVRVAFLSAPTPVGAAAATARPRLLVARTAVRTDNGQAVVFVVRDGIAVQRPVGLGPTDGDKVEVTSGVAAGDRVVVEGPKDLTNGRKVVVR